MVAVDGGIANLIQGVSQQPRRDRREGQCTLQENMSSDVVKNLSRRASTRLSKVLFNSEDTYSYLVLTTKKDGLHFIAFKDGVVRAFNSAGTEVTVNNGTNSYITPDMVSTVIDGDMVLAETNTTVEMASDIHALETRGLVQVLGGQYGKDYTLKLKYPPNPAVEIVLTYTTPNGSVASDIEDIATDNIAAEIETAANAFSDFTDHYTVTRRGDVLLFEWDTTNHGRMEITADDGQGGTQMVVVTDRTDRVSYLPRYAPEGYTAMVTGIDDTTADDVFFKFNQEVGGFGNEGIWEEAVKPGVKYKFDPDTMPHVLTYDADTTEFTLAAGVWDDMEAGDKETNPEPSFVGKVIEDLAMFQGRMSVLTDSTVVMSRTNNVYDFFKGSATTTVASDPIDIGSTAKSANNLSYMVPHNRDLVVFSDNAQFIVFGRTSLTPDNASLVLSTEFQVNTSVRPRLSGRNIFFLADYGNYSSVREFFTEGSTDANDSRPITTHVNKYVPAGMTNIASSSNYDAMLVHGTGSDAYIYQFLWDGNEKLQSSWGKWNLDGDLIFSHFDRSTLYIISRTDTDDILLSTLNFDSEDDEGVHYEVCLDRKQTATAVGDVYTLQSVNEGGMVAVQGTGCPHPGLRVQISTIDEDTNEVTLVGDMDGGEVIFGVPYLSRYKPTMPMIKDQNQIKIGTGNLILSRFILSYEATGTFRTVVTTPYTEPEYGYMSGRFIGDPANKVGEQPITRGSHEVPIGDDADIAEIEVYSSDHTPFTLVDIEWRGQWNKRGKRR